MCSVHHLTLPTHLIPTPPKSRPARRPRLSIPTSPFAYFPGSPCSPQAEAHIHTHPTNLCILPSNPSLSFAPRRAASPRPNTTGSRQMVIVLVGNIGSGKTTFCERLLKERGSSGGTSSSSSGGGGGGGGGEARGRGEVEDGEDDSPRFEVVSQDLLGSKDKVRRREGKREGEEVRRSARVAMCLYVFVCVVCVLWCLFHTTYGAFPSSTITHNNTSPNSHCFCHILSPPPFPHTLVLPSHPQSPPSISTLNPHPPHPQVYRACPIHRTNRRISI